MLVLGPIIGLVTDNTAIIMYEVQYPCMVQLSISPHNDGVKDIYVTSMIPTISHITDLVPNTSYIVTITIGTHTWNASFHTSPKKVHILSCNNVYKGDTHTWDWMLSSPSKYDMIMHIGDQVYNDYGGDTFDRAMQESTYDKMIEVFRGSYRYTWSLPHMKKILSSCSNIMLPDDHDIVDSWDQNMLFPPNWVDIVSDGGWYRLSQLYSENRDKAIIAGIQVMCEYQLPLCGKSIPGTHVISINGRNICLMNTRMMRVTSDRPIISQDIDVLISPIPIFMFSSMIVNKVSCKMLTSIGQRDINDMYNVHRDDMDYIKSILSNNPGCTIISGDSHMCGESILSYHGTKYKQYVTSGISTPVPPRLLWLLLLLCRFHKRRGINVMHQWWYRGNNYLYWDTDSMHIEHIIPRLLE